MPRNHRTQVRFPPLPLPKFFQRKSLGILHFLWQRTDCPHCRSVAPCAIQLNTSTSYIADHWDQLKPHIREAIFTLIDVSLQDDSQGAEA